MVYTIGGALFNQSKKLIAFKSSEENSRRSLIDSQYYGLPIK